MRKSTRRVGQSDLDWGAALRALTRYYRAGKWRVPQLRPERGNPFHVLISTILSQRTRDEATVKASERLFAAFPDAITLSRASLAEIARLTKVVGLPKSKVRGVREASRQIVARFGGTVPKSIEALLSLPMVGRKTANCVLVFGFGIPAVPVDRHIHRVSNRILGFKTRSPEETESLLVGVVPRRYWARLNPVLVQHGQNLCSPTRPQCGLCPIRKYCASANRIG